MQRLSSPPGQTFARCARASAGDARKYRDEPPLADRIAMWSAICFVTRDGRRASAAISTAPLEVFVSLSAINAANEMGQVSDQQIEGVVLDAIRAANRAREADAQLRVAPDAEIFGSGSPLDSLGLVGLLLDIEEGLAALGCDVVLSDDRAMSQQRTPFRSVATLVRYIATLVRA